MADTRKASQLQPFALAGSGVSIGGTSMILKSFKTIDGVNLAMTDFGTKGYMTLEPGNSTQEESFVFTGVTQNGDGTATLTGISTVLFLDPYTETAGFAKAHPGGASIVVTNTSAFYANYANKENDETITGSWLFPTPTLGSNAATKTYADALAIAGAPDASLTVKGIVEAATQAEADAKTSTGGTGALLFQTLDTQRSTLASDYVVDTGAVNAYVITPSPAITAYTTGQTFSFKTTNTNTGSSTLNVNGLGAVSITRTGGSSFVGAGDIVSGQMIDVAYDGTTFQMLSTIGTIPTGALLIWSLATAPSGFLLCNGAAVSRTTYNGLFNVITTTYGVGDGSTTFNVPNLQGRIPVGQNGATFSTLAGTGGAETHTLTIPEMPSHVHGGVVVAPTGVAAPYAFGGNTTIGSTAAEGGGGAHNNLQPYLVLTYIIKV